MSKPPKVQRPFPTKEKLLAFIRDSKTPVTKREIARAFHIRGDDVIILKDMLRELKREGSMKHGRKGGSLDGKGYDKKGHGEGGGLRKAGMTELTVLRYNSSGELLAAPDDEDAKPYRLICREDIPKPGERILAKLNEESHTANLIRILPEQLSHVLGIFRNEGANGIVQPVSRKIQEEFAVRIEESKNAEDGELVLCRILSGNTNRKHMRRLVEVIERVGRMDAPKSASMIAIQNQDIPVEFSGEALRIAESAKPPVMMPGRVDLRDIGLVTIDGADARDFDDAVWAEQDGNGWHLLVAIADVAHYVHFGTALDNEAFDRGNSVYFPDRVVPMLPEALSNGLCSLNPNEDRYCLAVHLWIDSKGNTKRYEFVRGIMRSKARLTYDQVQHAWDAKDETLLPVITPLYGVYEALNKNRGIRGALDLDLPEHRVIINEAGEVSSIDLRERFDSHKLIEECMIAANVAAAHLIENAEAPGMFRVHESPDADRVSNLRLFLRQMGYAIAKQEELSAHHFNAVIEDVNEKPEAHIIHLAILRSQMAAYYHPKNLGHFGLSLAQYCHFTSPIRRYSDLIVHRTLIDIIGACDKERDGLKFEQAQNLDSIATHISQTERRAMLAEREARERYLTAYMSKNIGKEYDGIIAGVTSFGLFVEIRENSAQGLVPTRSIGGDYWIHDKERSQLVGRSTGETFMLGQRVRILVEEADTITGSLRFSLLGREIRVSSRGERKSFDRKSFDKKREQRPGGFRNPSDKDSRPAKKRKDTSHKKKKNVSKSKKN